MVYDKNKFKSVSPVIASFSFTELSSGTGFITVQGSDVIDDTTRNYVLGEQIVFSQNEEKSDFGQISGATTTFTLGGSVDFNLSQFNIQRTIEGTAHVSLSFASQSLGNEANETYIIVKVIHWDGSTETILGSAQSQTISVGAVGTVTAHTELAISLIKKPFAQGDVVRLKIEGWAKHLGAGSSQPSNLFLAHSPTDDDGLKITVANSKTTQLKFQIPFNIDL